MKANELKEFVDDSTESQVIEFINRVGHKEYKFIVQAKKMKDGNRYKISNLRKNIDYLSEAKDLLNLLSKY